MKPHAPTLIQDLSEVNGKEVGSRIMQQKIVTAVIETDFSTKLQGKPHLPNGNGKGLSGFLRSLINKMSQSYRLSKKRKKKH